MCRTTRPDPIPGWDVEPGELGRTQDLICTPARDDEARLHESVLEVVSVHSHMVILAVALMALLWGEAQVLIGGLTRTYRNLA
jgi:hypothetical protein